MDLQMKSLTPMQVEEVHEKTLELLDKYGIVIHDDAVCEEMKSRGARVEGKTVFITEKMINDALKTVPKEFTLHAWDPAKTVKIGEDHPVVMGSCTGVSLLVDWNDVYRTANLEDFQTLMKLVQTSEALDVCLSSGLYPANSDSDQALLSQAYYSLTMCDKPNIGLADSEKAVKASIEAAKIATGLNDETVCMCIVNSLSPMAWDGKMLEALRVYAENGQAVNISCCSMAGATAPIYLAGPIISANAEVLTGIVYSQMVREGTPVVYGTTSSIMDIRTVGLSIGAAEYPIISTACAQMARRYGVPFRSGGGLTDAKEVDVQAGIESTSNLLFTMNNGVNLALQSCGILEAFLSMSFEKFMVDEEIILRNKRIKKGLGDIPEDIVDIIGENTKSGYLNTDSTLENFRTEFFMPKIASRDSYEIWKSQDKSMRKIIRAEYDKRIEAYQQPDMDGATLKEIQKCFSKYGYDVK